MEKIKASFKDPKFMSKENIEYINLIDQLFTEGPGTLVDKIDNFPKYSTRTSLARFIARYEIFKKVLEVQGSVIDCGVLFGGSLMTWAQLSSILEPANHQRRVIGFDTFTGFPSITEKDISKTEFAFRKKGSFSVDSYDDLQEAIKVYDMSRYLNHIEKVELIRGDICSTVPQYIKDNPQLVVSLLHLDVDIYEPTLKALEYFVPRMPKGAIIIFDELNAGVFPGETTALIEYIKDLNSLKVRRLPFGTSISYAEVE